MGIVMLAPQGEAGDMVDPRPLITEDGVVTVDMEAEADIALHTEGVIEAWAAVVIIIGVGRGRGIEIRGGMIAGSVIDIVGGAS